MRRLIARVRAIFQGRWLSAQELKDKLRDKARKLEIIKGVY